MFPTHPIMLLSPLLHHVRLDLLLGNGVIDLMSISIMNQYNAHGYTQCQIQSLFCSIIKGLV